MNTVVSPGDRVLVRSYVTGFARKPYRATVIEWTTRGKLKIRVDGSGKIVVVSSEDAKKVADKKPLENVSNKNQ